MLFVIVGPSGSGKTTLSHIFNDIGIPKVISSTTRSPRPNEEDGKDYNFMTVENFHKSIHNNEFIEYAQFGKNFYGTKASDIQQSLEKGNGFASIVMEINGFLSLKKSEFQVSGIFMNTSYRTLISRLNDRDFSEKDERIAMIKSELENIKHFNSDDIIIEEMSMEKLIQKAKEIFYMKGEENVFSNSKKHSF